MRINQFNTLAFTSFIIQRCVVVKFLFQIIITCTNMCEGQSFNNSVGDSFLFVKFENSEEKISFAEKQLTP